MKWPDLRQIWLRQLVSSIWEASSGHCTPPVSFFVGLVPVQKRPCRGMSQLFYSSFEPVADFHRKSSRSIRFPLNLSWQSMRGYEDTIEHRNTIGWVMPPRIKFHRQVVRSWDSSTRFCCLCRKKPSGPYPLDTRLSPKYHAGEFGASELGRKYNLIL